MQTCWVWDKSCPIGCSACLVQAADLSDCRSRDFANASHRDHSRLQVTRFMQMQVIVAIPDCRSHISCKCKPLHHSRLLLLQGKESWNKGKRLDQGTCEKMSAAKQGHTVPRSVCAKMSRSHTGLRPSQVCTGKLLSAYLRQAWM